MGLRRQKCYVIYFYLRVIISLDEIGNIPLENINVNFDD